MDHQGIDTATAQYVLEGGHSDVDPAPDVGGGCAFRPAARRCRTGGQAMRGASGPLGGETGQGHFLIAFGQRRNLPRQGCALWRQAKTDCPAIEIASLPRNKALLYEPINDTGQRRRVDRGVCDQFRKALVRFVSQRRADAPFTQTEIKRLERFGEGLPMRAPARATRYGTAASRS